MGKKNDYPLKEKCHLWWEYLRRSEKYKVFCKSPIKKAAKSEFLQLIGVNFLWGDVHKYPFEKWWGLRQEEIKMERGGVSLLREENLRIYLEIALAEFTQKKKRKPTINQFIDSAAKFLVKSEKMVFLEVFLGFWKVSADTLIKDFEGVIKNLIADGRIPAKPPTSNMDAEGIHISLIPTQPFFGTELKRYLQVYDLWIKRTKWREIAQVIHPKMEWNRSLERKLYMDKENAQKIIRNVEKGIFPGKY
jgi:hypothetical protein